MHSRRKTSKREELNVVHLVPATFGSQGVIGGAERYAFELARHMAYETKTTLVAFGDRASEQQVGPLVVKTVPATWNVRGQKTNPWSFKIVPELLRADIVHCHQQHILASSLTALICRMSGRKVFVSDLGGGGWDISSYVSTDRWYDAHLHISQYSRQIFGHDGKGWAKVIYGGVDTEKFSPDQSIHRNGTVLFVGRLLPHKGVDDLVEAVPHEMALELIGQPYDPRFLADLQRLGKDKRVVFRHSCTDEDLVQAYRTALCVVLPSVHKNRYGGETKVPELLGQTLLEGMACGTPVICTDVASMPEIVEDGVTGFIVPANNSQVLRERLVWLRNHPAEAAAMGEAGRQRVLERFVWPKVVADCLAIYAAAH
jgi:glycosyltransferase involved in cell wall biosynthesis